ncbi:prenyltransferase [Nocardioides dubius]|uniref:Prenyltransferase n=1 Tax=Nocardioides dubius TaxID=317019 RepID=A0ABP4E598_9ACTN
MRPDSPRSRPAAPVDDVRDVLSPADIARSAASIVAMQEADGAIPWVAGEHTDVWNHVEGAMAMLVGGEVAAAERAYEWVRSTQRADGSWPMKIVGGVVEDHSAETNMSAYIAVGVWHHWLVRRDLDFVRRFWPTVRRALDFVVSLQLDWGGIAWSQEWTDGRPGKVNEEGLLACSSSIYQSLRAGVAIAELLGDPQPEWELAGGRLGHAVREHAGEFLDKSEWSMDWYYPVLGGAVSDDAARELLGNAEWDRFVVEGLGIRCVGKNDWVTGAETCELVMALDASGRREQALALFADMQHLRADEGRYWTGYVWPDDVNWPVEHSSYTAAAVILAYDQLAGLTGGADIMKGATLPAPFAEIGLTCDCPSADEVPSLS